MLPKQPDKCGDVPAKQFSKATGKELIQANSQVGEKARGAKVTEKCIVGSDKKYQNTKGTKACCVQGCTALEQKA